MKMALLEEGMVVVETLVVLEEGEDEASVEVFVKEEEDEVGVVLVPPNTNEMAWIPMRMIPVVAQNVVMMNT